jgi:hypothetical protein
MVRLLCHRRLSSGNIDGRPPALEPLCTAVPGVGNAPQHRIYALRSLDGASTPHMHLSRRVQVQQRRVARLTARRHPVQAPRELRQSLSAAGGNVGTMQHGPSSHAAGRGDQPELAWSHVSV